MQVKTISNSEVVFDKILNRVKLELSKNQIEL